MKTIFKAAMLFASALLVFSSCLKEQTGLSIGDIPGTAKVMGKLSINEGQAYEGDKFVDLKKPAANVEVIVKVSNDDLSPNGASGYTDYTTTTKEDGSFEVIVPAVDAGVAYEVVAPAFVGVKKTLSSQVIKDGEFLFEETEGVYEFNKTGSGLKPGSVEVVSGVYSFKPFDKEVSLDEYVDFRVAVGLGKPLSTSTSKEDQNNGIYKYNGEIELADGVDVVIEVKYGHIDDGDYKGQTLSYGGTTDNGILEISLPCTSASAMKSAEITVRPQEFLGTTEFTYYTLVEHQTDDTKTKQASCDIPAESSTFAGAPVKDSYNFDFFVPTVKVVMTVNEIADGADEGIITRINDDKDDNDTYEKNYIKKYNDLKGNWASFWTVNKFELDEE